MKTLFLILYAVFLVACTVNPYQAPDWVSDPEGGVVGSCGFNAKGKYAQEECARTRAREQLAARKGVLVHSESLLKERVHNDIANLSMDKKTYQEVSNIEVQATEKASWYNARTQVFYVWMEDTK